MAGRGRRWSAKAGVMLVVTAGALTGTSSAVATVPKGQLDASFGNGGTTVLGADTKLLGTSVQTDGKVVAVGVTGEKANQPRLLVVRFGTNGRLDGSFGGGQVRGGVGSSGSAVAIQPDGKIVVAGTLQVGTSSTMFVERLNANGSVDGGFGGGVARAFPQRGQAFAVALQPDGKIVVGGSATAADGSDRSAVARFTAQGGLDTSFSGGAVLVDLGRLSVVNSMAVQGDGRVVIAGSQRGDLRNTNLIAARLNANGSRDGSFAGGGLILQLGTGFTSGNGVALQPDGKVVVAGASTNPAGGSSAVILRFTGSGGLDGGFGAGGLVRLPATDSPVQYNQEAPYPGANAVAVVGGEIVAAGYFDSLRVKRLAVWGLNGNGSLDGGFGTGGRTITPLSNANLDANAIAIAPGGGIVIAGDASPVLSPTTGFVSRLGGPVVPVPVVRLQVTIKLSKRYKIKTVAKSGLRIPVTCNQACKTSGTLTVSNKTARKIGLRSRKSKNRRAVQIGKGSASTKAAGKTTLKVRLTRPAKRALGRQRRSVRATLKVTTKAGKQSKSLSRSISLTR